MIVGNIELLTLQKIIDSEDFKNELRVLSSWGANIKQEAPIVYALAKLLDKKGYNIALEWKVKSRQKNDMMINEAILEAKFFYEEDIEQRLKKEFNKDNKNIDQMLFRINEAKKNNKNLPFNVGYSILKDIFEKTPDFFMLILLSRDLKNVSETDLKFINWTDNCLKYNKKFGYNNQEIFNILIEFLEKIRNKKQFEDICIDFNINTKFPSTYHIYLFDFR